MKERPILFNAEMVRALLDGRKTQTRRIVKPTKDRNGSGCHLSPCEVAGEINAGDYFLCPYGQPGDRLWVKETWRPQGVLSPWDLGVTYAADGEQRIIKDGEFGDKDWNMPKAAAKGNVSPLFMPRWASRITLEIVSVRVERLQDISESEALAEGVIGEEEAKAAGLEWFDKPRRAFQFLWQRINGAESWDANPWIWVITFKRLEDTDDRYQRIAS
ncbi:hypothetical protein Q8G38_00300 [Halomonas venusta]|uniref:hypothetical protein n=1 Tax=Vreelandella venusta TaxID=44935 RepID=UPI00295F34F1|nr:hypothetical protein [Halomonas venusta]MDW0357749.1 hypothetical protein [Halomonas venusta]